MKTNKTPMQELIDYFYEQKQMSHYAMISETFRSVIAELEEAKPKEKQFAFDCFEAGLQNYSDHVISVSFHSDFDCENDFEQFYSQYAEQHKE